MASKPSAKDVAPRISIITDYGTTSQRVRRVIFAEDDLAAHVAVVRKQYPARALSLLGPFIHGGDNTALQVVEVPA